jgi:hypothetical protein
MAGWPAWLRVAEQNRGRAALAVRLRQLNGTLHRSMQEALKRLPTAAKALTPAGDTARDCPRTPRHA